MSLWDIVKSGAKSLWSSVKSAFNTGDTYNDAVSNDVTNNTGKQTLNQQIANGNIINNTTTNTNINDTTNRINGFDLIKEQINTPTTPIDSNVVQQSVPVEASDKEEEGLWNKIGNWISSGGPTKVALKAVNWADEKIQDIKRGAIIQNEYNKQEEHLALGYNPKNRNVFFLDLNDDRGLFDWDWGADSGGASKKRFDELYTEAINEYNQTGDYNTAINNLYDKSKNLFRLRSDDLYNNGLFYDGLKVKRRDNMYTQDELDQLAQTGKTQKGAYVPTIEEFIDYLAVYENNLETQQELGILEDEYNPDSEQIKIDAGKASDWTGEMTDIAMRNFDDMISSINNINPNAATKARLTYSTDVLGSWLPRWYAHVSGVYKAEEEILGRDSSTWSWQDKYLLEQAKKARQLDKQFAENVNDLLRQTLLYGTDSSGNIVSTPDIFENGESLNDVLTKGLRDIAGEDKPWYAPGESWIDIAEKFANNALYIYNTDKGSDLKKAWNSLEYFLSPVGGALGELGQQLWIAGSNVLSGATLGLIGNALNREYMDQDATAFRLMETDDGNIKRTINKYHLQFIEYTPEVLGNIVPDILLYGATTPGLVTKFSSMARTTKAASNAAKAAKGASLLNKLRVITGLAKGEKAADALGLSASEYSRIINAAKTYKGTNSWYQRIKTAAQLVDRATTQLGLGQLMDAQWSVYDTEPYSQASFLMSTIGSVMFDILPEITKLATGRGVFGLMTGRDSIWSLAKYIDSSSEAKEYISKALRKGSKDINVNDLESFVKSYGVIEEAAKQAYNQLDDLQKEQIGKLSKAMIYNYVNQAFGANSTIGRAVRKIIENKNSNIADVVKYIARISGDVSMGPYISTIRLKNGTRVNVFTDGTKGYDAVLDSVLDGGFARRIDDGFTEADLNKLSKTDKYSDVEKNKSKWFDSVTTDGKGTMYYLNERGLKHFGLKAENVTLESLGITLKEAENTREALNKVKGAKGVNISDAAIDSLSETGGYDEITEKVKEVLGC